MDICTRTYRLWLTNRQKPKFRFEKAVVSLHRRLCWCQKYMINMCLIGSFVSKDLFDRMINDWFCTDSLILDPISYKKLHVRIAKVLLILYRQQGSCLAVLILIGTRKVTITWTGTKGKKRDYIYAPLFFRWPADHYWGELTKRQVYTSCFKLSLPLIVNSGLIISSV